MQSNNSPAEGEDKKIPQSTFIVSDYKPDPTGAEVVIGHNITIPKDTPLEEVDKILKKK